MMHRAQQLIPFIPAVVQLSAQHLIVILTEEQIVLARALLIAAARRRVEKQAAEGYAK